ncbi:MAG: hypothetical protein MZV64_28655 [Ignavibacteriales bacterium]|nr:hypothetical protein [Ignavibacteriales bacterium]
MASGHRGVAYGHRGVAYRTPRRGLWTPHRDSCLVSFHQNRTAASMVAPALGVSARARAYLPRENAEVHVEEQEPQAAAHRYVSLVDACADREEREQSPQRRHGAISTGRRP